MDLKNALSHFFIFVIWKSFERSEGPTTDIRSYIKSDFFFRKLTEFLESDVAEITQFCRNDDYQYSNESFVDVDGENIAIFEKP